MDALATLLIMLLKALVESSNSPLPLTLKVVLLAPRVMVTLSTPVKSRVEVAGRATTVTPVSASMFWLPLPVMVMVLALALLNARSPVSFKLASTPSPSEPAVWPPTVNLPPLKVTLALDLKLPAAMVRPLEVPPVMVVLFSRLS